MAWRIAGASVSDTSDFSIKFSRRGNLSPVTPPGKIRSSHSPPSDSHYDRPEIPWGARVSSRTRTMTISWYLSEPINGEKEREIIIEVLQNKDQDKYFEEKSNIGKN